MLFATTFWGSFTGKDNFMRGWLVLGFGFENYLKFEDILYVMNPELLMILLSLIDLEDCNYPLTFPILSSKISFLGMNLKLLASILNLLNIELR